MPQLGANESQKRLWRQGLAAALVAARCDQTDRQYTIRVLAEFSVQSLQAAIALEMLGEQLVPESKRPASRLEISSRTNFVVRVDTRRNWRTMSLPIVWNQR